MSASIRDLCIPIAIRNFVFSGSRLGSYLEVAIEPTHSNTGVLRGLAIEELSNMALRCFQKDEILNCDGYSSSSPMSIGLRCALASILGLITATRNRLYDKSILPIYKSKLPVISVGNLTVGGNGKSPFIRYLAKGLIEKGIRPAIVLRGYGGKSKGPELVTGQSTASQVGDEALEHYLALGGYGLTIVVARKRALGAQLLEKRELADVILLDDGFQHRALARDLDIVLFNSTDSAGTGLLVNERLLPHGRLRESVDLAIERIDILVETCRTVEVGETDISISRRMHQFSGLPVVMQRIKASGFCELFGGKTYPTDHLLSKEIIAVGGLANNQPFFSMLEALGCKITDKYSYRDHYPYTKDDYISWCKKGLPIVCTAKDAVKLKDFVSERDPVFVLIVDSTIEDPAEREVFWNSVRKVIR